MALSWTKPSSDGGSEITGYTYRYKASGTWLGTRSVGLVTSATQTGLAHSTLYTFEVWAVNAQGAGAVASATATTPSAPSNPPPDQEGSVSLTTTNPVVGSPVTATLTDPDGGIYGASWQWLKFQPSSGDLTVLPDEAIETYPELSSYTPTRQDIGLGLKARVKS